MFIYVSLISHKEKRSLCCANFPRKKISIWHIFSFVINIENVRQRKIRLRYIAYKPIFILFNLAFIINAIFKHNVDFYWSKRC